MKKLPLTIQRGLSLEYRRYKKDIDKAITQVLGGGRYVLGKELERFEQRFAELVGTKYAIGVGSGFDALYISLVIVGGEGKKRVFVSGEPSIFAKHAVIMSGNVLVEEPRSADIYIPVITPIERERRLVGFDGIVIEDACQSIGMKRKVHDYVTTSCYSFHPLKLLHCYGDGGAIATNSRDLYAIIKVFRNHGRAGVITLIDGSGINSRLDEIQAAVLNVMMDKLKNKI